MKRRLTIIAAVLAAVVLTTTLYVTTKQADAIRNERADRPLIYLGSDGFLRWTDTNERFVMVESNSPENRMAILRDDPETFFDHLDFYAANGVNTIYLTAYGGDDTSIFLTDDLIPVWRAALEYWSDEVWRRQGRPGVVHIVLGEQENHHLLNDDERAALFRRAMVVLDGIPAVFLLGEEITQRVGLPYVKKWCSFIRQESPAYYGASAVISLHNELHWRPWDGLEGLGMFDLIAFQGRVEQARDELPATFQRFMNSGTPVAIQNSELANATCGIPASDPGGDTEIGLEWTWCNYQICSGFGFYAGYEPACPDGCGDLSCPRPEIHKTLYNHAATSARVMASGGGPHAAWLLGVPVPSTNDVPSFQQPDKNGDGIIDAADML